MASEMTRRDFVKVGGAGAAAALVIGSAGVGAAPPMPERALGRTGHKVRLFSLGGQATLEKAGTRDESMAIINRDDAADQPELHRRGHEDASP
jgi:hypothetical protein